MKACTTCGAVKAPSEFQVRRASRDGRTASCKCCLREYDKRRSCLASRVQARANYAMTPTGKSVHDRAKLKYANSQHGKTLKLETVRAYRRNNPEARNAHAAVERAIKAGVLRPLLCEVCGSKAHAHHPHYGSPLLVTWLCPSHHKQAHALIKESA